MHVFTHLQIVEEAGWQTIPYETILLSYPSPDCQYPICMRGNTMLQSP